MVRALVVVGGFVLYHYLPGPYDVVFLAVCVGGVLGAIGVGRAPTYPDRATGPLTDHVVHISNPGTKHIEVVKVLREHTDARARDLLEQLRAAPAAIPVRVADADGDDLVQRLQRRGATAEIAPQ